MEQILMFSEKMCKTTTIHPVEVSDLLLCFRLEDGMKWLVIWGSIGVFLLEVV